MEEVLDTEEKYGGNRQRKSYPKRKLLPEFDDEDIVPILRITIRPINQTDHLVAETERLTNPHPLPIKEGRSQPRSRNTIYVKTWTKRLVEPGPSMDPGNVFPHRIMAIKPNIPVTY